MKEKKYRFIGNDGEFDKEEVLTIVEDRDNNNLCKLYSNGEREEWLHTESNVNPDVNLIVSFEIGSKWVAKCNITSARYVRGINIISERQCLQVVEITGIGRNKVIEFLGHIFLTYAESELLLDPWVEPLKEMTAEQIAEEFNVKVVG